MTTRMIYHDFRKTQNTTPGIMLTAPVLSKGRRLIKSVANLNAALNTMCIFLCGVCAGVSLLIILLLALWG